MQLGVPVEWITESNEEVLSHQESFHPIKKRDSLEEFNNIVTDNDGTTTPQSTGLLLIVCEDVDEILHVEVLDIIITQCFNTFEILENINSKSSSRSFDLPSICHMPSIPRFKTVLLIKCWGPCVRN